MAQDRTATLADIRLQLRALSGEMDGLKRELTASGATLPTVSGSTLERLDGLESQLRRLTAQTEELSFRIDQIVSDGTNRLGDLEFRLVELEGGDLGSVGETRPLGSDGVTPPLVMVPPAPQPELAVGERSDFEAANAKLSAGDNAGALDGLDRFLADYPRSPMTAAVHLARGKALSGLNRHADAGRSYLEAFTLAETSDPTVASAGLLGLGQSLATLGQTREACLALGQVGARFSGLPAAEAAKTELAGLSCS